MHKTKLRRPTCRKLHRRPGPLPDGDSWAETRGDIQEDPPIDAASDPKKGHGHVHHFANTWNEAIFARQWHGWDCRHDGWSLQHCLWEQDARRQATPARRHEDLAGANRGLRWWCDICGRRPHDLTSYWQQHGSALDLRARRQQQPLEETLNQNGLKVRRSAAHGHYSYRWLDRQWREWQGDETELDPAW